MNYLLLFSLCATYGLFFPIGKLVVDTHQIITPLYLIGIRFSIAGLLCMLFVGMWQKKWQIIQTKHIIPLLIISILSIHATNALELWALQTMDAGKTCFIYSCSPIISALIGYAWYKERLTILQMCALLGGVLGFLPVILDTNATDVGRSFWHFSFGEFAILSSSVLNIMGWMAVKQLNQEMSFLQVNGISMFVGGLTSLVHAMSTETATFALQWQDHASTIMLCIAGLIILSNLISYNLHAFLLNRMSVTMINFACLSCSFFAAVFSFILIQEPIRMPLIQSMLLVIPALSIYFIEQIKPGFLKSWIQQNCSRFACAKKPSSVKR